MNTIQKSVFLADDDADDCVLFEDALREVCNETMLTTANDGRELMAILTEKVPPPPDVIFLDLNMPLKNGFECLTEIRATSKLKAIPVIIFSTSAEQEYVDRVYEQGADYYMCKPESYSVLKSALTSILAYNWHNHSQQPSRDKFLLRF